MADVCDDIQVEYAMCGYALVSPGVVCSCASRNSCKPANQEGQVLHSTDQISKSNS